MKIQRTKIEASFHPSVIENLLLNAVEENPEEWFKMIEAL